MAMSFTEGSIGGDIERIDLDALREFYSSSSRHLSRDRLFFSGAGGRRVPGQARDDELANEPQGSNGIAIAPALTSDGHALLLINPHTSFYFRSELQMSSDEGLDAYGAATWGQFFIYQGFNPHIGWMHTSSGVDNVDEFAEKVERRGKALLLSVRQRPAGRSACGPMTIRYRTAERPARARAASPPRSRTTARSCARTNGRWIAFAMMNRPVEALQQSYLRTKASDLASFMQIAQLKANSSNNTIFADDKGEIAYLHPQFVPRRDDRFDYTKPVDGSDPATDWGSLHALSRAAQRRSIRPTAGSTTPTTGPSRRPAPFSPSRELSRDTWTCPARITAAIHALRLLTGSRGWTLDRLQAAAFDSYQPGFAVLIPMLVAGL